MNTNEPLYGYSIKDITQLEVEIERLKRKRNICIIVGSIIAGLGIIGAIFFGVRAISDLIKATSSQEIKNIDIVFDLVFAVLEIIVVAGEAIAIAGGVTSHVKAKRRESILNRLKQIKRENPEFEQNKNLIELK